MSLEQWMQNGWLKPHKTSDQEIRNFMEGAIEDLKVPVRTVLLGGSLLRHITPLLGFAQSYSISRDIKPLETRNIIEQSHRYH